MEEGGVMSVRRIESETEYVDFLNEFEEIILAKREQYKGEGANSFYYALEDICSEYNIEMIWEG